mgnify:CR=1 FL=1
MNYYENRVIEAEEINENLRKVGKSNINELMAELKDLSIIITFYTKFWKKIKLMNWIISISDVNMI